MESSIFKLIEVEYCEKKPRYPYFEVKCSEIGYYSNLDKAEEALKKYERDENASFDAPRGQFCFFINEYALDEASHQLAKSRRSYLPDGSPWTENLLSENVSTEGDCLSTMFSGRTADKQRFKKGDLVEVFNGTNVTLEIVSGQPFTPEEVNELREKDDENTLYNDYRDDCYRTLNEYGRQSHTNVVCVFPPRMQVNEDLRKNLLTKCQLETEIFLYSKIYGNKFFRLVEIEHRKENPESSKYEKFRIVLGCYSTIDEAEQALCKKIESKGVSDNLSRFGFMIEEFLVEKMTFWCIKSRHIYAPDGSLVTTWYY